MADLRRHFAGHRALQAGAAIGALLTLIARWPGTLTPDSISQLAQAQALHFTDWHPPIMAMIWAIWPVPQFMLVLQVALLWAGLYLIATTVAGKWRYAMLLLGLSPAALFYGGVILKDSLLAAGLMLAAGCLAKGWRWTGGIVAVLSAFLRVNAGFAVGPLVTRRLIWTPLIAVALALTVQASARIVADRTAVTNSLPLYDLTGIDHFSGGKRFPPGCYTPLFWDTLGTERCDKAHFKLDAKPDWLGAIVAHPFAYLQHRAAHFNRATFFLVPFAQQCVEAPEMHDCPASLIKEMVLKNALFWPCVWLVIGLLLLRLPIGRLASAICLSGLSYGGAYFFLGVASDFRYFYWTELAVQAALVLAVARGVSVKVPLIGGLAVAAIGYAARLLL